MFCHKSDKIWHLCCASRVLIWVTANVLLREEDYPMLLLGLTTYFIQKYTAYL